MSKALEEARAAYFMTYGDEPATRMPKAIRAYLQHHLEHPEAVARAVREAMIREEEVTGDILTDINETWHFEIGKAKAALQCLIEDLG